MNILAYEDLVDISEVIAKLHYLWGSCLCILGISYGQGEKWEYCVGVAKRIIDTCYG